MSLNRLLAVHLVNANSTSPAVMEINERLQKRTEPATRAPTFLSGRPNTGSAGAATVFNAEEQYVDITPGSGHEFMAPGPGDIRGTY